MLTCHAENRLRGGGGSLVLPSRQAVRECGGLGQGRDGEGKLTTWNDVARSLGPLPVSV